MANLKEIRKRINSVKNTQKITSAMKMVSAAKLRRATDAIHEATPYSSKLKEVVSRLSANFTEEDHSLFRKTSGARVAVILVTSDRGLCGGFNTNLCKAVLTELRATGVANASFTILGRKGRDYMKRTKHTSAQVYVETHESKRAELVDKIVADHVDKFEKGEVDRVILAYNHFQSALSQVPVVSNLLPLEPPALDDPADERETIFEPSAKDILDELLKTFVANQVQVSWIDSNAGEHGARMNAMDSATKNAGEMIEKLQLYYNRTRQAAITSELIEIISGAESL